MTPTQPEKRVLLAEAQGYQDIHIEEFDHRTYIYHAGTMELNDEVPNPFESERDALALCEFMRGKGWQVHLNLTHDWCVTLVRYDEHEHFVECRDASLPIAISEACGRALGRWTE